MGKAEGGSRRPVDAPWRLLPRSEQRGMTSKQIPIYHTRVRRQAECTSEVRTEEAGKPSAEFLFLSRPSLPSPFPGFVSPAMGRTSFWIFVKQVLTNLLEGVHFQFAKLKNQKIRPPVFLMKSIEIHMKDCTLGMFALSVCNLGCL